MVHFSALLLGLIIAGNAWHAYSQWQRVRMVRCDEPVFKFGRAFVGDVVDHTFRLTNAGRSTLQIAAVRTDCGCTTVAKELKGSELAAGQSVDVPVKLSVSRAVDEDVERKVVLEFAGKPPFKVTLRLKGRIEARWDWSPAAVIFDTVNRNETSRRTVKLKLRRGAPPANVAAVTTTGALFNAGVSAAVDSGGEPFSEIAITTVPPLPLGRHRAELYFYTSDSSAPTGPVPITVDVAE